MTRKGYHVVPMGEGWGVRRAERKNVRSNVYAGDERGSFHLSKTAAVACAKRLSKKRHWIK